MPLIEYFCYVVYIFQVICTIKKKKKKCSTRLGVNGGAQFRLALFATVDELWLMGPCRNDGMSPFRAGPARPEHRPRRDTFTRNI